MNWGNKLILVFVAFAALIATLVYKAVNTKYELVSKDYYTEELRYQDKIDGVRNANALSAVTVQQNADELEITLPAEMKGKTVSGELWLYCPTDAARDRKIKIDPDKTAVVRISKSRLSKGSFSLRLNWQAEKDKYYTEQQLNVY
jgi:nitrogen fixation protein FixH